MTKAIDEMTLVEEKAANIKIAEDVFLEYFGLFKAHDRFDVYDLIIDCRERLYSVTFEQCKSALYNLASARVIRSGLVNNQYILIKGSDK